MAEWVKYQLNNPEMADVDIAASLGGIKHALEVEGGTIFNSGNTSGNTTVAIRYPHDRGMILVFGADRQHNAGKFAVELPEEDGSPPMVDPLEVRDDATTVPT